MNDVQFGMNQYCGPAVLSIFTGLDTDMIADEVIKLFPRKDVKGLYPAELIRVGKKLGLEFKENEAFKERSLFWTASALVNFPGQYLIIVPNHYITIEVLEMKQIFICDNHTKTPIDLKNSSRLSQKVEGLWKVTKVFDYVPPTLESEEIVTDVIGNTVYIKQIITHSDGGVKVRPLGTIVTADINTLGTIAHQLFKLIKLSEGTVV